MTRLAFVTNVCPHYRIRTFETLARHLNVDYFFFSAGNEWYWTHQPGTGHFQHKPIAGLLVGRYDAYVKCINGRVALPLTYLLARLRGKPFILWTGVWMRLQTPAHRLFYPLTRYLYRHADAVVVYGTHVRQFLEREGVRRDRIFVAPHAVDNAAYNRVVTPEELLSLRHALGLDADVKVVLFVGRLEEGKGLPYLLTAFASLESTAVLVLAGTGSEDARLKQLAHSLGIADRVRFPGYIDPGATVPYYALAWVSVLPSVTTPLFKEPWGLVVNEAFNQGVPVIATNAVGAAVGGLVDDGRNGYVVPERDAPSLAQALQRLLDNPDLRNQLGRHARQTVDQWDNERMVSGFRQALEHVVTPRPRRGDNARPERQRQNNGLDQRSPRDT